MMMPAPYAPAAPAGVTCPWCKRYWPSISAETVCGNCGGALPAPPGPSRGLAPPPSPRQLPERYVRDLYFSKNVLAIIGTFFAAFGGLFGGLGVFLIFVLLPLGLAFTAFGALFGGLGLVLRRQGRKAPERQIAALTQGVCAEGQIVTIGQDFSETINGRNPFRIDYVFSVQGQPVSGSTRGWDVIHAMRRPGEPLWVVYLPTDPTVNSIWPPVS